MQFLNFNWSLIIGLIFWSNHYLKNEWNRSPNKINFKFNTNNVSELKEEWQQILKPIIH